MTSIDKYEVEGSFNLKTSKNNIMYAFFIRIYLSLMEICKECLMREHAKKTYRIFTRLVGRHNSSSMLMYQCWFMVVVFHNILTFMTEFKKYQILPRPYKGSYSGEKGHPFFSRTMYSFISQIS